MLSKLSIILFVIAGLIIGVGIYSGIESIAPIGGVLAIATTLLSVFSKIQKRQDDFLENTNNIPQILVR
jgi:hypothetical protein